MNTSSALSLQAELSLYYGIPLLAFALPAAVEGLRSPAFDRVTGSRFAFVLPLALVFVNVAHFEFPAADPERAEVVRKLESIPSSEGIQAMSCFHPVLGYAREKSVLNTDSPLDAPWIVLRMRGPTWPVEDPATLLQRARAAGYEEVEVIGETRILHRARATVH